MAEAKPMTNVLLSWSKPGSKAVALAFHSWLPKVIPGINPWMSSKDIDKGRDWDGELHGTLKEVKVCIVCMTAENVRSPYIYYETGAIAVKGDGVLVLPYLIGISVGMLSDGPLKRFQCTDATHDDTFELIKSLNKNALNNRHDPTLLEGNYKSKWPEFEKQLQPLLEIEPSKSESENFIVTDADEVAGFRLTSEARKVLVETAQDEHGSVSFIKTRDAGLVVSTNHKSLCEEKSPRAAARWIAARDDLEGRGLLRATYKDEVYDLTDAGFRVAEALS